MTTSVYDTDDNGTVDDAETVNNLTVETAVPSGALFTDTQLTDAEVETIVTNAGFLTTEVDGSISNELVSAFEINGANLELTDAGGTIQIPVSSFGDGFEANTDNQTATEVGVTPGGNLAANNVQAALLELDGDITTATATIADDAVTTAKIADGAVTDAKITDVDFSKINNADAGIGALGYIKTETDDQTATEVGVTPGGNLAANNVQAALLELDGEITAVPGSPWNTSGSDVNYTAGNVGIGISSPTRTFDILGDDASFVTAQITNTNSDGSASFEIANDNRSYDLGVGGSTGSFANSFYIYDWDTDIQRLVMSPTEFFIHNPNGEKVISVDEFDDVTIGEETSAGSSLYVYGTISALDGYLSHDVAGTTPLLTLANSSGDVSTEFIGGTLDYSIGIDDSQNNSFRIAQSSDFIDGASQEGIWLENVGEVGINTSSPQSQLHVRGRTDTGLGVILATNSSDQTVFRVENDGDISINAALISTDADVGDPYTNTFGTIRSTNSGLLYVDTYDWGFWSGVDASNVTTSYNVEVDGDLLCTGTFTDISDRRLKENLIDITNAGEKLKALKGYSYNMIGDSAMTREYGLMAQDVQKVLPYAVSIIDPDNDYLGLSYVQLIPVLVEAHKEQQDSIEALQKELVVLKESLASSESSKASLEEKLEKQATDIAEIKIALGLGTEIAIGDKK